MNHDYNTQRTRMALPEYGRNVQKMIEYIKTIDDRDERNRAARTVIKIMGNLNPHLRDFGDFKHKLWDHINIIAQFDLDIDSDYPPPEVEKLLEKPVKVDYLSGEVKFLHYGRIAEMLVAKVVKLPDGEERNYLTILIANQMKKSAAIWNKGVISDEIIFKDLTKLSKGVIKVPEGVKLMEVKDIIVQKKKKNPRNSGKQQKKKFHTRY